MRVGEHIKMLRHEKKLSQQDLADQLRISRQSVSRWENGTALPTFDNIVAISDDFGVTLDELIGDDVQLMKKLRKPQLGYRQIILLYGLIVIAGIIGFCMNMSQHHLYDAWVAPTLEIIGTVLLIPISIELSRTTWWRKLSVPVRYGFWIAAGCFWMSAMIGIFTGFFSVMMAR